MTVLCFSEWNIRLRLNIVSEGTMEYKSHSDCMPGKFLRSVMSVQYTKWHRRLCKERLTSKYYLNAEEACQIKVRVPLNQKSLGNRICLK